MYRGDKMSQKKAKKLVSMRLSEDTIKELTSIAKQEKISQADVIAVLVHLYHVGEWEADRVYEWLEIVRRA